MSIDPMFSREVQWVLLLALMVVVGFLLITVAVLARRVRKRREDKEAVLRRMEVAFKDEYDHRTQDALERTFGRKTLYRREMAQRELDRYNGLTVRPDVDPTYEEWCTEKGYDEVTV